MTTPDTPTLADTIRRLDGEGTPGAWDRGHGTDCDGLEHPLDGCEHENPYRAT